MHISQCDAQLILPNAPAKELRRYVQGEYIYVPLKLENGCSSHVITAAAFVAGEGFDRHECAVVALHEIGEHGGKAAAGGNDHAAGIGDDLVRERTVEDADILD